MAEYSGRHASREGLTATIQRVNEQGLLIVGSVGRAAFFTAHAGGPNLEFNRRRPRENPLVQRIIRRPNEFDTFPRDVDVIGGVPLESIDYGPHAPDAQAFQHEALSITKDNTGDWWIQKRDETPRQLDPILFEPVEGTTVLDIPCVTVRPSLHFVLVGALPHPRSKERLAAELVDRYLPADERALLQTEPFLSLANSIYFSE
jgi:hypothetical protein